MTRGLPTLAGLALLVLGPCFPGVAAAETRDVAGVITEIRVGDGDVQVKAAGREGWRGVEPLMALRPGDVVRATGSASAVVLLTVGRGMVVVDAGSGPLVVPGAPPPGAVVEKARALLGASLEFLSARPSDAPRTVLGTRGTAGPPVVLAPRDAPVLADSLIFDWAGHRFARYTVQIAGPAGIVFERKGLTGGRLEYPRDAPALTPEVSYTLRVLASDGPPEEARFEVLSARRTLAVRRALASLEREVGDPVSPTTMTVLRAGLLGQKGLTHEARLLLLEGLARDPSEPVLHVLLGTIYARSGLAEQAARAFDEARFLLGRRAGR
jgi:hypothetical protein